MRDKITVALIGAGRIGLEHARNLASLPEVQVALVCDPLIEAAKRVGPLARAAGITDSPEEVFCSERYRSGRYLHADEYACGNDRAGGQVKKSRLL